MKLFSEDLKNSIRKNSAHFFNSGTLKNIVFFTGGIVVFIIGVIAYGIVVNIREVPLSDILKEKNIDKIEQPWILVDRKLNTLNLYDDTVLLKTYRANFGMNIGTPKSRENDFCTPVGEYRICAKYSVHKYHKFLSLNYPNLSDADDALRKGVISQKDYDKLKFDFYYGDCPVTHTVLGCNIGIQGIGEYNNIFKNLPFAYNWTDGSISISNEGIDELFPIVMKGTKVVIR